MERDEIKMANIFDYMQWRDIPLTKTEFNEIDNLILARFSYFPLDEKIISNAEKITIKESYKRYETNRKKNNFLQLLFICQMIIYMLLLEEQIIL